MSVYTRSETALIADLAQHAATEAAKAIIRVANTAPDDLRHGILTTAFALVEVKSVGLRKAGIGISAEFVAALAPSDSAKLDTRLRAAGFDFGRTHG